MIIDSQELFSYGQAVTAVGDTPSTNSLDTGSQADDGVGYNPYISVIATSAAAGGGTIQAVYQTSVDNTTFTDVVAGPALSAAQVTAGKILLQTRLPVGCKRYNRVVYRVATTAFTGGTYNAFHSLNIQNNQPQPSGFSVA